MGGGQQKKISFGSLGKKIWLKHVNNISKQNKLQGFLEAVLGGGLPPPKKIGYSPQKNEGKKFFFRRGSLYLHFPLLPKQH